MGKTKSVEQQKILRVFKLINLLRSNIGKSANSLAEILGTDRRTVYRYFQLLRELGFQVEREYGKFKITDRVEYSKNTFYGTFSDDEAAYLVEVMNKSSKKNLLKASILEKVQVRSDFQQSVSQLFNAKLGRFVDELSHAIKNKFQVLLKDYYSLSSDSVSDRLVEPVVFSNNFESVYALEVASREMKMFKLERIAELKVTSKHHLFEQLHEPLEQGLFGFTGKDQFKVRLRLSKKAYQLLIEEHPDAKPYTYSKANNTYYLEREVPELPGIGRFVLGLPGEIYVEKGEELKAYLEQQMKKAENMFSAFEQDKV
ncbi:helix-turn-helix transcriptional regulator [Echinicola vietnamensis]|uniref:Putative transcriptional regulator n=1 Tax=Echinicola vietnamensis (strain DSM 17526 / LMG 23754 / KMM 6221) TaxID=926556 RepID=L0G2P6_ECHVK|nr:WYL domain-containing protein [Echinicola vietnamensis]AGA79110.1 putative transcriptional regulator [Echinicola vietnamensis DSM 17526]